MLRIVAFDNLRARTIAGTSRLVNFMPAFDDNVGAPAHCQPDGGGRPHSRRIETHALHLRTCDLPQNWRTPIIRSIEAAEVFNEDEKNVHERVQG